MNIFKKKSFFSGNAGKWIIVGFLSCILGTVFAPSVPVQADESKERLVFDTTSETGDGYEWDAASKTLTLSGCTLDGQGLNLPGDSVIVLKEGTENFINVQGENGIYTQDKLTITGDGSLSITTSEYGIFNSVCIKGNSTVNINSGKSGIYVWDSWEPVQILENAALNIITQESGIETTAFVGVEISGSTVISIDAQVEGGIRCDTLKVSGCQKLDISAGTNAVCVDTDPLLIKDCEELSIHSAGNGLIGISISIENTTFDITTVGVGLVPDNSLTLKNITSGVFHPGEHGGAIDAGQVTIDSSKLNIESGNRGIECSPKSLTIQNNSTVEIASEYAKTMKNLTLDASSSMTLSGNTETVLPDSDTWKINGTFINNGAFINNGVLEGNGTFVNNGIFTQEKTGSFAFDGQMESSQDSLVYVSGADAETTEKLSGLGTVMSIMESPLDYTKEPVPEDGAGYSWDAATKTLILSGLQMRLSSEAADTAAIRLPEGAKIQLASGTKNSIEVKGENGKGIRGEGDLLVYGGGSININSLRGIAVDTGSTLTLVDTAVSLSAPAGITTQTLYTSHAQLAIMATEEGTCVTATKGIQIEASNIGWYSQAGTVLRVPNEEAGADVVQMAGLPEGVEVSRTDEGVLVLISSDDISLLKNLEIMNNYSSAHVVFFESNTDTVIPYVIVEDNTTVSEPKVTKDGYTLTGWYVSSDFSGESYNFDTPVVSDKTLYAKWKKNESPADPGSESTPEANPLEGNNSKLPSDNTEKSPIPSTGDNSYFELYYLLLVLSAGVLLIRKIVR